MLASLDDGHVSLTAPGREVFFSNRIRRHKIDDELFDLNVVKEGIPGKWI
jgi:carboxyl-terminal processing protease